MGYLLWTVAGLVGLILLALLLVLAPMRITASASGAPAPRLRVGVALLWGLVPAIAVVDSDRPATPRREKRRKKREKRRKKRGKRRGRWRVEPRRVIAAAPGLLRGLVRAVRFERLQVDGRFGLTDPAATGELYGALMPYLYTLPPSERIRLALAPSFDGPTLEGRAEAALRLFPGGMAAAAIRFAWRAFGPRR